MTDFGLHPSQELRDLFAGMEISHQGQDPRKARVIFVGTDANEGRRGARNLFV
jgi:hypothetical protein